MHFRETKSIAEGMSFLRSFATNNNKRGRVDNLVAFPFLPLKKV